MNRLADRLRGVLRGGPPEGGAYENTVVDNETNGADLGIRRSRLQAAQADLAAETLGGEWRETRGHRFVIVDRKYGPGHRHGRLALADGLPPSSGVWPRLSLLAGSDCAANVVFIDLETTGLAGGAGTYAFLVGCGWFEGGCFRVRQFFLSRFAAERALLEAVAEIADTAGTIVTYNGKTYDLPLIENRFIFHRLRMPFSEVPHVDMLHPARRLWADSRIGGARAASAFGFPMTTASEGGCRLSSLEQRLCGHEREGDVPGFEIPSRYFHYVRTGDARPLEAVLEHNRLDLLSLAMVTARAAQLLEDGPDAAATAREALGLGRLYERGEMMDLSRACFARAAGIDRGQPADPETRAEALRAYAVLSRRLRCYADAADAWQRIVELRACPPQIVREAIDALAVHHEHRLRDPQTARAFAVQSLHLQSTPGRRDAVHHRLARLDRKLGGSAPSPVLF